MDVPLSDPSMRNSTRSTRRLSDADTAIVAVPESVAPAVGAVMVTVGRVVSIVHVYAATPLSSPDELTAITSKRWLPAPSDAYVRGLVHEANDAASSRQR